MLNPRIYHHRTIKIATQEESQDYIKKKKRKVAANLKIVNRFL